MDGKKPRWLTPLVRELGINGKETALNVFKHKWTSIGEGRLLGDMVMCASHHSYLADRTFLLKHKAPNFSGLQICCMPSCCSSSPSPHHQQTVSSEPGIGEVHALFTTPPIFPPPLHSQMRTPNKDQKGWEILPVSHPFVEGMNSEVIIASLLTVVLRRINRLGHHQKKEQNLYYTHAYD